MIDIFPFIFSEYRSVMAFTTISKKQTTENRIINGVSSSIFSPVRSLSMKNLWNPGLMILNAYAITVDSTTKATASPAPCNLFVANSTVLFLFPLFSKLFPGFIKRHIPVKASSNSLIGTTMVPLAGSFK